MTTLGQAPPRRSACKTINSSTVDELLIERFRSGDERAFDQLVTRYRRHIYNHAYRLCRNHEDAEDVVSEALIRICLRIHLIQNAMALSAWMNRVVSNVYIDMFRRARRFPCVSLEALPEWSESAILHATCVGQYVPEQLAEVNELRRMMGIAIAALPDALRPVVVLFHDHGRSYDEIANALNIPIGTVKSRLNSARAILRKSLHSSRMERLN